MGVRTADGVNFRKAHVQEYAHWLTLFLDSWKLPTHFYDYPFARWNFLVPLKPFRVNGECGAKANSFLVHERHYFIPSRLGHNQILIFGNPPEIIDASPSVPVFSDPEFRGLSLKLDEFMKSEKIKSDRRKEEALRRWQEKEERFRR